MSFILDALKKSQSSRQQQSGPGTIAVETAPRAQQPHNWLAIVIAIVVLNLAVIAMFAWFITRDKASNDAISASVATQRVQSTQNTQPLPAATAAPASQSGTITIPEPRRTADNSRGEVRPLSAEVREPKSPETTATTTAAATPPVASGSVAASNKPTPSESAGFLPTLAELQLDQRIQLSPLHIDVHVYNENPQRRFVLINARKYKEGERLSEGPLLEEIRRDGLVMYYRDQRFLVPRD